MKAGISTHQILTLSNLKGVGPKAIMKVGNNLFDCNRIINNKSEFVTILDELKVKKKNLDGKGTTAITLSDLNEAENIAQRILSASEREGIGIISYYEEDFPDILKSTIDEEGKSAPPMLLFYKGDISIINMPCIAVIGTREITPNGEKAGLYISREFAKRGFCIVSGLAIGCDTVGHKGALEVGGKTIAFLAHGLDSVYPSQNKELAEEILSKGGLLLSEYPIGMEVNRYNLIARDRLQAGLSMATIVIQTGEKGGTMHAANITLIAGKPLYTIYYQDQETREHEKTKGNALLVSKGAKYIKGNDDLDNISDFIKMNMLNNVE